MIQPFVGVPIWQAGRQRPKSPHRRREAGSAEASQPPQLPPEAWQRATLCSTTGTDLADIWRKSAEFGPLLVEIGKTRQTAPAPSMGRLGSCVGPSSLLGPRAGQMWQGLDEICATSAEICLMLANAGPDSVESGRLRLQSARAQPGLAGNVAPDETPCGTRHRTSNEKSGRRVRVRARIRDVELLHVPIAPPSPPPRCSGLRARRAA